MTCSRWPETTEQNSSRYQDKCAGCKSYISYPSVKEILSQDQFNQREDALKKIREHIINDNAALVLGSGISVPSKMPTWYALISQMLGYALQKDILHDYNNDPNKLYDLSKPQQLIQLTQKLLNGKISLLDGVNTLESAEYIAQFFDDLKAEKWVRDQLPEISISTMVAKIIDKSFSPSQLFAEKFKDAKLDTTISADTESAISKETAASNNTMFAVSYLMAAEKGIHRAMTYNYDPLVQEHLIDLFGIDPDTILTHPGKWNKKTASPVQREFFHVHGFVTGKRHDDENRPNVYPPQSDTGPLVLSEDSYYKIEQREAYNWSSSIQSYFLNKYHCVFVGFSAEDYNFRRIMRQMGEVKTDKHGKKNEEVEAGCEEEFVENGNKKCKHYLILTIGDWIRNTFEAVCRCYFFEEKKCATPEGLEQVKRDTIYLLQKVLDSRGRYWERFGVCPIWCTVEEIPGLLTSLLL